MQTKTKDTVTIRNEATALSDQARERLEKHIHSLKQSMQSENHGELDSEILNLMESHNQGQSLKGPGGLAAKAKQSTVHLSKLGNQKHILRFLTLHAANEKLQERLNKQAADIAVAMAAKRVSDLLKAHSA